MDSILKKQFFDRIYRIFLIFYFPQFPEETEVSHSTGGRNKFDFNWNVSSVG